jgi:hypothetical protein
MENENGVMILCVVLFVAIAALIIAKIAEFFTHFNSDTRYITGEMRRAVDYNQYRYWRRELRCHYLCLIPFVTERNVMRVYRFFFHRGKHAQDEIRSDGVIHILAPSIIGICICTICLCGASWAWFTASIGSSTTKIQAATYSVEVTSKTGETDVPIMSAGNGISEISLKSGQTYTVMLRAGGTAENGFCTVDFEDTDYYTKQLAPGLMLTFIVNASKDSIMTITPQWGTCAAEPADRINGEEIIGTVSEMPSNDAETIEDNTSQTDTIESTDDNTN